jgi:hypothetical protein
MRHEGYACVVTSGDTHPLAYGAWIKKDVRTTTPERDGPVEDREV